MGGSVNFEHINRYVKEDIEMDITKAYTAFATALACGRDRSLGEMKEDFRNPEEVKRLYMADYEADATRRIIDAYYSMRIEGVTQEGALEGIKNHVDWLVKQDINQAGPLVLRNKEPYETKIKLAKEKGDYCAYRILYCLEDIVRKPLDLFGDREELGEKAKRAARNWREHQLEREAQRRAAPIPPKR